MLEAPGLLGDNAVANKNPQYFHRLPSKDHRCRQDESLFFPFNISISHLMSSADRNAVISD
jgi:hypothetical protein